MTRWLVMVIDKETGAVVRAWECPSERHAMRMEAGLNINLDHGKYRTDRNELVKP